ncbi:MAG TPA: outer membrane beta-barrel domain-containing protein [Myxococcota bacterium]|nr:outer membrane beta-barrel domain-containing protein [Myxococcota bacterium]
MALRPRTALLASLLVAGSAAAQETVDIGVIKDSDIRVVQNLLYPKTDTIEVGVYLGWMPFDPLVTTPNLQISINRHFSEELSLSAMIGGGYGLKTGRYTELEGPAYGVAPYAFRYLASGLVGVEWAPIYAKMSLGGRRVVHYDIYGAARLGATLEQSVIPAGGVTAAPTLALGIGSRFFVNKGMTVRFEVYDDLLVEYRKLTTDWHFKQNAGVQLGVTFFPGAKR